MENAYIGFGSNLGNRVGNVARALSLLASTPGVQLIKVSSLYRTAPVGAMPQPDFVNGVAKIRTAMTPEQLLRCLHRIEKRLGRVRLGKNLPRPIDLDILEHGDQRLQSPDLVLPHPRMKERKFVLKPLGEVSPRWRRFSGTGNAAGQAVEKLQEACLHVR